MKNLLLTLFAVLTVAVSCVKKTDCGATVICTDEYGAPVSNAKVKLFATVKTNSSTVVADVKADGITDSEGKVKFIFKLPAIFDISATTIVGTKTLSSAGIIKLEEGKNAEKAITLQ